MATSLVTPGLMGPMGAGIPPSPVISGPSLILPGRAAKRKPTKAIERALPWKTVKLDLDSVKHGKVRDWIINRLQYSALAKREIERMAMLADQHYCSFLNEKANPWAVTTYDPVLFSTAQMRLAKMADAMFSSPPIWDYEPGRDSTWAQAQTMTSIMNYHLRKIRPRARILAGFNATTLAGTTAWHLWWDYKERKRSFWQRVPLKTLSMNLQTGEVEPLWIEDGDYAWIKKKRVIRDSPNFRPLHITQWFPDDRVEDVQDGEWFIVSDYMSAVDAREKVVTEGWDSRAVERAIRMQLPMRAEVQLRSALHWSEEIGMRVGAIPQQLFTEDGKERNAVEVIECWRRKEFELERIVLLNRAWVCYYGPSPFGHALYPFVITKNYPLHGRFWALSDYQISRYLIRGIQSMRGAAGHQALMTAMPPLLRHQSVVLSGLRWEPGAEVNYTGPIGWQPQWLVPNEMSRQVGHAEADILAARMDSALGSSDPGRGGFGAQGEKGTATALSIAAQAGGLRDKLLADNFSDDWTIPVADQAQELVQQFQDYELQVSVTGQKGEPVTIYPEDFRSAQLYGVATASTSALKALKQKQVSDMYQLMILRAHDPNVDAREVTQAYIEQVAPEYKDRFMKPQEQVAAEMQQQMQARGMPGQVRMGGPPMPGAPGMTPGGPGPSPMGQPPFQSPYAPTGQDLFGQQASLSELQEAYSA